MANYLIAHHLGMGDMIVLNGLVRHIYDREKAKGNTVYLLCKEHNMKNVTRMYRDLEIGYVVLKDGEDIGQTITRCKREGYQVEDLHLWGGEVYKYPDYCDEAFFLNFNYPVELLQKFEIERSKDWQNDLEKYAALKLNAFGEYIFVHDDPDRGLSIDESKLPQGIRIIRPGKEIPMFDLLGVMENAKECHFISSSFLCIAIAYKGLCKNATAHLYVKNQFLKPYLEKYGIKTIL